MSGVELIAAERERQIKEEGWTAEHDSAYQSGELNDAAICYAQASAKQARGESWAFLKSMLSFIYWPWEDKWWKPSAERVRNLVKAGALIAAEIDRLQRNFTPSAEEQPDAELDRICSTRSAEVNRYLRARGHIGREQSYRSMPAAFRARVLKNPAAFLKAARGERRAE